MDEEPHAPVSQFDGIFQDLRYAVRALRKSPGFTLTVVLTIALGIGSFTTIFSVVNSVLLRPLPYAAPDRLVALAESNVSSPGLDAISFATARVYREQCRTLENLVEYNDGGGGRLLEGDTAEELRGQSVSPDFFRMLGIRARLGRVFQPEDALPGRNDVIILGYGLWQRLFGADPRIVGRELQINGVPIRVIGVLPADFHPFHMSNPGEAPQVFRPMRLAALKSTDYRSGVTAIAKLKPGITLAAARAELNRIARDFARDHGNVDPRSASVAVEPLYDKMTRGIRTACWVLLGAVVFVLLIACANVANLMLARASGRASEIVVRAALGCGRGRLVRQFLTESLLVALVGGLAGVLLARFAIGALVAAAPTEIPRLDEIRIDSIVLLVALAATVASAALSGLAPALRAARLDWNETLRGARDPAGGRAARRMRASLVTAEIACSLLLAVGAGLLGRSLDNLLRVDPGYDPHHILTMTAFAHDYDTSEKVMGYYRQLVERVGALPGVESAAMVSTLPLSTPVQGTVMPESQPPRDPRDAPVVDLAFATTGYFHLMRIPLLEGRNFDVRDGAQAPKVTVISRSCARLLFPNQDPIGRRIHSDSLGPGWIAVIGVVGDVWQHGMDDGPSAGLYIPQEQRSDFYYRLLVRTVGDPWRMYPAVRRAMHDINPREPMFHVQPMDDYVSKSLAGRIFILSLIGSLGTLALVLAAVGIYGVISYSVTLRTREVGIRMALGAGRRAVIALVLRDLLTMLAWGLAAGLAAALVLTRLLAHLLYHVQPTDVPAMLFATGVLVAVALVAAYLPCRRATAISPSAVL